jgi:hypothetical protein
MNAEEMFKFPKEWEFSHNDSPLAIQAYRTYGPLGSFLNYKISALGINKSQITFKDLLETILILYMNNYSQYLVLFINHYRNMKTNSQERIWRR